MLRSTAVGALLAVLIGVLADECTAVNAAVPTDKIESKVIDRIRTSGVARVFVRLNVQVRTQEKLRPEEKQAQLEQIRAAQGSVLEELEGTRYKLSRKFEIAPTISMEIGQDALAVLKRSSHVLRVYEIEKVYLNPGEIVPHKENSSRAQ